MTNILLSSILVITLALGVTLCFMFVRFVRIYANFKAFVTPKAEGEISELGKTVSPIMQAMADMVGRSVVMTLKATFMGKESGDARAEKAINADISADLLGDSKLGALVDSFPTLKKSLRRNPKLAELALSVLGSRLSTNQPTATAIIPNNGNNQMKFKL